MIASQNSKFLGLIVGSVILSRIVAEAVNTFFWDKMNYVWSSLALVFFALFMLPLFIYLKRRDYFVLAEYWPIFIYLAFGLLRIKLDLFYSLKCFFSELIVWSLFIFTAAVCSKDKKAAESLEKFVILISKVLVLVGLFQLVVFVLDIKSIDIREYVELRPVQSIFIHQSICLIMTIPFLFYFLKQRSFLWVAVFFIVCLGTGTRSPFLALCLMALLVMKSTLRWEIKWRDIILTLLIIIVAYGALIKMNSYGWSYENVDSRFSFGTLQWRVDFWRRFLNDNSGLAIIIGHGLGTADYLARGYITGSIYPPHNDYVRIFYDQGIVGLILYINLIVFMLRLMMRTQNKKNDFIIIIYIMILCFSITDNFIYVTNTALIYVFLAIFVGKQSLEREEKVCMESAAAQTAAI